MIEYIQQVTKAMCDGFGLHPVPQDELLYRLSKHELSQWCNVSWEDLSQNAKIREAFINTKKYYLKKIYDDEQVKDKAEFLKKQVEQLTYYIMTNVNEYRNPYAEAMYVYSVHGLPLNSEKKSKPSDLLFYYGQKLNKEIKKETDSNGAYDQGSAQEVIATGIRCFTSRAKVLPVLIEMAGLQTRVRW